MGVAAQARCRAELKAMVGRLEDLDDSETPSSSHIKETGCPEALSAEMCR